VEVGFKGQMQAYQLRQHMVSYNIATYTACMLWLKDIIGLFSGFDKVLRNSFKKINLLTKQIVNSRIEVV